MGRKEPFSFERDKCGDRQMENSKAPYQTAIMDAFTQRGVEEIVIKSGAQCGKSEILMNMMGRCIDLDPGPMMMVQPSQSTADDFQSSASRRWWSAARC